MWKYHPKKQIQESNKTYQPNEKIPLVRLADLIFVKDSDLTGGFSSMKKTTSDRVETILGLVER